MQYSHLDLNKIIPNKIIHAWAMRVRKCTNDYLYKIISNKLDIAPAADCAALSI
jgi:hypothetical protein